MLWVEIDWSRCQGCSPCLARQACKPRAIVQVPGDDLVYIEHDRCRGCAVCLPACAHSAIYKNSESYNRSQA